MQIDRIFTLFDSLITPVATYASPLWLPYNIPVKSQETREGLIGFWEKTKCETIHQKCARIALSVNKNTSRLAVLGELGRYPLLLQSLAQCLNYKLSLSSRRSSNHLINSALCEMTTLSKTSVDNWLKRVEHFEKILNIPKTIFFNKSSGKKLLKVLKSHFDIHFLNKINEIKKSSSDDLDHNKLRTYKTVKSSFTREPYLELVRNRNQRCFLSRLRVSSHRLNIELGRHTRPITPVGQRYCQYCCSGPPTTPCSQRTCLHSPCCSNPAMTAADPALDNEFHFLLQCPMFDAERKCLFTRLSSLIPGFDKLSLTCKFQTLLCPTTALATKLTHRFIKNMFAQREKYDNAKQDNNRVS